MAVRATERPRWAEDARIIPFPGDRAPRPEPGDRVVAVVLSDGTVQAVGREAAPAGDRPFATGQVSGDGWILWWERRSFEEDG